MRFERLDLSRYGRFTDQRIAFDPAVPGQPDLHLVYGSNEAGKTTAVSAVLDLLFGIEPRSRFNFLHDYQTMRIGAALELGGETREIVRIKRNQGSLIDARGQPIDEAPLKAALSGLDRNAYQDAFFMDEASLEAGGEGILASQGELGRSLFAASAGLADLSQRIAEARADADAFHKARARTGELASLKARLVELKRERDLIDTLAVRHAQLAAERDAASRRYEDALAMRGATLARTEMLGRTLRALPLVATLRTLRDQAGELSDLPKAPISWRAEVPELRVRSIEGTTRLNVLEATIERLSAEVDGIAVDGAALALVADVEALGTLRARHETAEIDLPEREAQLRAMDLAIAALIQRLGVGPDTPATSLLIDAPTWGTLRDLMDRRSGIEADLRGARGERLEAGRLQEDARAALDGLGDLDREASQASLERLSETLSSARESDHEARRRVAERECARWKGETEAALAELRPWTGTVDKLEGMSVPPAHDVAAWSARSRDLDDRTAIAAGELARAEAERTRFQAELDASAAISGWYPEEDAGSVRTARERAWATHRQLLDHGSADAFEAALRKDDALTAARMGHAGDLARLRLALEGRGLAIGAADRAKAALVAAAAELRAFQSKVSEASAGLGGGLDALDPAGFEAWMSRRSVALGVRQRAMAAERDLVEADRDRGAHRSRLSAALEDVGVDVGEGSSLDALMSHARAALSRASAAALARESLVKAEGDVARRNQALGVAEAVDVEWHEAWDTACSRCWLGRDGQRRSVAEVRGSMEVLEQLAPALDQRRSLVERIAKMEADRSSFATRVALLADGFAALDRRGGPVEIASRLRELATRASANATKLRDKNTEIEAARSERQGIVDVSAALRARLAEMLSFFGVSTLDEVDQRLEKIARRADLIERCDALEREVAATVGMVATEAERSLLEVERPVVEAEIAEARSRLEGLDVEVRDAFASLALARQALDAIGSDDAVALLAERRRTTLLEISEGAIRHLRLRVGVIAAEEAIRIYREQHRSTMMRTAADAFSALTCGSYAYLDSRPERNGETLVAVSSQGGSRTVDRMSKGTRHQLYLALRVAAHAEFIRYRSSVPFLVDDVLETFDDDRAERAFAMLARMALSGQVLVFTHHAHLRRIATAACPGVHIHELPPATSLPT